MKIIINGEAVELPIVGGGGSGGGGVPKGTIVIWSGGVEDIPTGWALCDGQDGRPDLRGRFVLGASPTLTRYMFTSQNQGAANSTASIVLTPAKDISSLKVAYEVSSEANYDKFSILNGDATILEPVSGLVSSSIELVNLTTSDQLTFQYKKDGSGDKNGDTARFWIETADGKALSKSQYQELFTLSYPNNYTFVGANESLTEIPAPGSTGGSNTATVPLLNHTHEVEGQGTIDGEAVKLASIAIRDDDGISFSLPKITFSNPELIPAGEKGRVLTATNPAGATSNADISILPPYYALCYIIKETESAPEAAVEDYDTADGWHVRKWPDGYVKMIYKGSNPFRELYEAPYTYYVANTSISLPIVLVEKYSENLSLLDSSNTGNPKIPVVYTAGDNEKTNQWGVLITTKATGVTMNYSIVVTGRWK